MENKLVVIVLLFSLALRVYVYLYLGTILGADVGRFAIISHTWFLKKQVTPNLQPYDMAESFFYFPFLLIPYAFEYLGIDSITTITFISYATSFLGVLVFYKIARLFLDKEKALISTAFYSFIFDIVFAYNLMGVFPYGIASFFFLIVMWQSLKFVIENKINLPLLFVGFFGILLFHWYLFFGVMLLFFALISYEWVENKTIKNSKKLLFYYFVVNVIGLIILSPYLSIFFKYFGIAQKSENAVDLFSYASGRIKFGPLKALESILFVSYPGTIFSSVYIASFILFLLSIKSFLKGKESIWLYFFIYTVLFSLFVFNELNLVRITTLLWLLYAFVIGFCFKSKLVLLVIPFLVLVQSASPLYLTYALHFKQEHFVPFVDFSKFNKAIEFIKTLPENSTFLIDGGGAGCTGASANYGERIFPLTSRKIFYFTNYCWADYNRSEYRNRVDLYRRVSINASCCINELKAYNITHIFIGEKRVGFDPKYFLNNSNYELVYNESDYYIFKVV
jgi:hypothetical protein